MSQRLLILAAFVTSISALPAARADLAAASPFLPVGGSSASAPGGPSGPIELRGMMSTAQGMAYCIYDTSKRRDVWVGLNESGHDFVVRSADPDSDTVKVDYQGRTLSLTLHSSKVASAGPASASRDFQRSEISAGPPSPAEEQKRLDAVAQEVRRRKLEREKAFQQERQGPSR